MLEGAGKLVDELILLRGQGVGVLPVHGGEISVLQVIGVPVNDDALVLVVDLVQQQPVIHPKAGIAHNFLAL